MIGTVLGNRYELVEKVGTGGMAVVYKAMDKLLNRYVAVKLLRSEFQGNEEFIRRFNIESQAAASLSHANVVSIYDVGQSGDEQYIVMEFVEGKTLKEYISEKKGAIYWKEATDITMQICSALEHAHSKHIIHRDIKPQNIMINTDGVIKVTDFGIARAASGGTTTMEAMGSAHYLSPEQARGGYTDQRSDIYSLGVVMYELFTGKLPFDGENPVSVAMQHMQSEPVKPRNINGDIPTSIENIIIKAMSKEQRLRYESATQMLSDIKKAYADPESTIATSEDDSDKFGTRKITPIVNITIPSDEEKVVIRRDERKKEKEKETRKEIVTLVAAIVTCFIIACVAGYIVAGTGVFGGKEQKEENYDMPNVQGLERAEALEELKILRSLGFEVEEIYVYNSNVPKGEVIGQAPKKGVIEEGDKITITISRGLEDINLDDYTNRSEEEVKKELEAKGIIVNTSQEMSNDVEEGKIIRQLPTAGQVVQTGDSVRIFVSSGPNKFALANYVGEVGAEAKAELEAQGIKVIVETVYNDTVPSGVVVSQTPPEKTEMKKGDSVTLSVSQGSELMSVPNLVGLTQSEAKDMLLKNNLKLGTVTEITSGQVKGVVVKQSIASREKVSKNTAVDIFVSKGTEIADDTVSDSGL